MNTYIQMIPENIHLLLKHMYDTHMCFCWGQQWYALARLSANVEHHLEAWVLECLNWLADKDQIDVPLKLTRTYLICLDEPLNHGFLKSLVTVWYNLHVMWVKMI